MNDVVNFLKENPVQYVSTVGLDTKPKVRPFQFMLEKDEKLWFCTSNQKDVYMELQKNPYVQISAASSKASWIRISAKAVFVNDMDVKEEIIASNGLVRSLYQTADNKTLETFYLADATAGIYDFSGNPPKKYIL